MCLSSVLSLNFVATFGTDFQRFRGMIVVVGLGYCLDNSDFAVSLGYWLEDDADFVARLGY